MSDQATPTLAEAIHALRERGVAVLPGRTSNPTLRWRRDQRRAQVVLVAAAIVGVAAFIVGIALRLVGIWALGMPIGLFLVFVGLTAAGILAAVAAGHRPRLLAELEPVRIDADGIRLRGIGPVPWADVGPPERRVIRTKHDISGPCAVLPLTPYGVARANSSPFAATHLVGPRPYLHTQVTALLLPGIDGLSEDETIELFRAAYARYGHHGATRG